MKHIAHDSETPAKGQQVITACAFIHHTFDSVDKVFLPKRASTKKFLPNVYELPGGHIEYGEDIVEGLKREIKEEFDMHIKVGDPYYVFTYDNEVKESHSIEVVYFATFIDPIENIKLQPEDHSEYGWYTKEEINSKVLSKDKGVEDIEIKAIYKGFNILEGQSLNEGA